MKKKYPNRGKPIKIGKLTSDGVFLMSEEDETLRALNFITAMAMIFEHYGAKVHFKHNGPGIFSVSGINSKIVRDLRKAIKSYGLKGITISRC